MGFWRKKEPEIKVEKKVKRKVWGITKKTLKLILEVSKENYPMEFGGLLRHEKGIITEIILLPGTVSGESHAIFQLHMRPIDFSIIGTVHSHPSYNFNPSEADRELFSKFGSTHIIAGMPFNENSWQGYNYKGDSIELSIMD